MSVGIASIDVPDEVRSGDYEVVLSISGGKDSTATALALREAGVSYRMVFADTGWEAAETYEHLDHLRAKLGPIDVVGTPGGMVAKVEARANFPARLQRWCTKELKLDPLREYHDSIGRETISVVGVRAAESESRARMAEWEDDETWGGWLWRPILRWTVEDVLAVHHRHGVEINPLYKRGHERVGCYPCVFSVKEEIRLIAEHAPERIVQIRSLEESATKARAQRNMEQPGRYSHPLATFFQTRDRKEGTAMPIDEIVKWARTEHGGRQWSLLPPPPDGGCFRWGMCEAPSLSAQEEKNSNKET